MEHKANQPPATSHQPPATSHQPPATTHQRLITTLLHCAPLQNDRELNALFVAEELNRWHNRLPEANNPTQRAELLVSYLRYRQTAVGKNALVAFLNLLAERASDQTSCYADLLACANQLQRARPSPPPNPFGYSGCVRRADRYLIRQPFTDMLFHELSKGNNLSIVGATQTGKSSLLHHLVQTGAEWLGRPTQDFAHINLELVHSDGDFFELVCGELGVPTQRGFRLGRALRGRKVVLCLDEIEKMTWDGFTLELRSELRGLADGPSQPFTLVIASRSPLDHLFPDSPVMTSPLAYICQRYDLPPFTLAETRALWHQRVGDGWLPEADLTALWQETQGHAGQIQQGLKGVYQKVYGKTNNT